MRKRRARCAADRGRSRSSRPRPAAIAIRAVRGRVGGLAGTWRRLDDRRRATSLRGILNQERVQQDSGMNGRGSGEMLDLMAARKSRCRDDGSGGCSADSRQELSLTDHSRQVVVLALVSKRACHAATAGVKIHDVAAGNLSEQAEHGGGADESLLVAVSMGEDLLRAGVQSWLSARGPLFKGKARGSDSASFLLQLTAQ